MMVLAGLWNSSDMRPHLPLNGYCIGLSFFLLNTSQQIHTSSPVKNYIKSTGKHRDLDHTNEA